MNKENFMHQEEKNYKVSRHNEVATEGVAINKDEIFNDAIENRINVYALRTLSQSDRGDFKGLLSPEKLRTEEMQNVVLSHNNVSKKRWDAIKAQQDGDNDKYLQLDKERMDAFKEVVLITQKAVESGIGGYNKITSSVLLESTKNPGEYRGLQQDILFNELNNIKNAKLELLKKGKKQAEEYHSKDLSGDELFKFVIDIKKKRIDYINKIYNEYKDDNTSKGQKGRKVAEKNIKEAQLELAVLDGSLEKFLIDKKIKEKNLTKEEADVVLRAYKENLEDKEKNEAN